MYRRLTWSGVLCVLHGKVCHEVVYIEALLEETLKSNGVWVPETLLVIQAAMEEMDVMCINAF